MSTQEPMPSEEEVTNDPGDAPSNSVTTETSDQESAVIADDPLKSLQGALKEKEEELAAEKDRFARLQAETDNFRKRMGREKEEFRQFANERLFKQLVPIFDNLERALEAPSTNVETLKQGITMILDQFESFLKKENVTPIKAVGEKFNPSVHDVMTQEESGEHEENTVIRQFTKGYQLNNRVLRPSQVVISKKPAGDDKKSPDKKSKKTKKNEDPSSVKTSGG